MNRIPSRHSRHLLVAIVACVLGPSSVTAPRASTHAPQSMYDLRTAVAASAGVAVVSRTGDTSDAEGAVEIPRGVFVFERGSERWQLASKLSAGEPESEFGWAVAASRTTLAISAPLAEPQPPETIRTRGRGAVFVFGRAAGEWILTDRLSLSARIEDEWVPSTKFGTAVATDGETLVVGAPSYWTEPDERHGAAIVYARSEGSWSEVCRLLPENVRWPYEFGKSVAVEGNTLVVGAPRGPKYGGGVVHIFERKGETWEQVRRVVLDRNECSRFGSSVAISGDHIAVGSGVTFRPEYGQESGFRLWKCEECELDEGTSFVLTRDRDGQWGSPVRLTDHAKEDHVGCLTTVAMGPRVCVVGERVSLREDDQTGVSSIRIFERTDSGEWTRSRELEEEARRLTTDTAVAGSEVLVATVGRETEAEACTIGRVLGIGASGEDSSLVVCKEPR